MSAKQYVESHSTRIEINLFLKIYDWCDECVYAITHLTIIYTLRTAYKIFDTVINENLLHSSYVEPICVMEKSKI